MSGRTSVASAADWTTAWSTPSSVATRSAMPRARSARRSGFWRAASAIVEVFDVSKAVRCTHHAERASDAHRSPSVSRIVARARRTAGVWPPALRPYDRVVARGQVRTSVGGRCSAARCCCGALAAAARGGSGAGSARSERCRTCGYRYERQPGFLLGAVTINTIVTFGLLAGVLLVGTILSYPDIAVVPMLVASGVVAILVPIVFYPFSYTIWAAVDLAMRPLGPRGSRPMPPPTPASIRCADSSRRCLNEHSFEVTLLSSSPETL